MGKEDGIVTDKKKNQKSELELEIRKKSELEIITNQEKIDYDIRDFTIDYLVTQFASDRFFIPEYQRQFVWNDNTQARFIESILLGIPIPFLFLAVDDETGNFEIVDGAQRIRTLRRFMGNDLKLVNLKNLSKSNGFYFKDLTSSTQRKFENRALRMIVLEDKTTVESRKEIFNRINTAGVRATPVEVRMGTYDGPFIEFVKKLALDELYQKLAPMTDTSTDRKEQYELIFRFFAYSDELENYSDNVKVQDFIDSYAKRNQNEFEVDRLEQEFNRTMQFVSKNFPNGFRKTKGANSTPKARFEAIAVGVNLALRENENITLSDIDWINSEEFQNVTTSDAANNKSKLVRRINYVKNKLLGV
ncbi:DUF262 domain-containing protein [Vagococcus fluvialis]|uniref:DUF262 domain-containing protein n=1 Tax=Vagococcus fluvialis TaxID=2738 RepID=UPI001D09DCBE|nr:DUF262 domain-containing protein [Vagococcus fluvialis]UDM73550.1 DUF262 domain-containing protein [Vagococcus fluvialis]